MKYRHENGNVLFLILIAVALFAALSYAITNSTRSSGSDATEPAKILASKIIQFGSQVTTEVQRKQVIGKIDPTQLDFGSNVLLQHISVVWPSNPNCTSNKCRVFGSVGGTVPEALFVDSTTTYNVPLSSGRPFPGHPTVMRTNVLGAGTSADDLVLYITGLSPEVCIAIDNLVGVPTLWTGPQEVFASWGQSAMAGPTANYWSLDQTVLPEPLGDENTSIQNQPYGCLQSLSSLLNTYYHVLVAR